MIEPDIKFRSKVIIEGVPRLRIRSLDKKILNNLIFHLGLIEALSYWKASCSPEIEIKAGPLGEELRSSSRTSSLERVRKNFNSFGFANARVVDELCSSSRFANARVYESIKNWSFLVFGV